MSEALAAAMQSLSETVQGILSPVTETIETATDTAAFGVRVAALTPLIIAGTVVAGAAYVLTNPDANKSIQQALGMGKIRVG